MKKRIITLCTAAALLIQCGVSAKTITDYSINENDESLTVEGKVDGENVKINYWLRKNGTIMDVQQTKSDENGEYFFTSDLGAIASSGGVFSVKVSPQTEIAEDIELEYYTVQERERVYKDIAEHISDSTYVGNAIEKNAAVLSFANTRLKALIGSGKADKIALFLKAEAPSLDNLLPMINVAADVKTMEFSTDKDEIKKIFEECRSMGEDESPVGLKNNEVINLFDDTHIDSLCETVMQCEKDYSDTEKFVESVEDAVVLAEAYSARGTDGLNNVLERYSMKLDFTEFNQSNNDKAQVLTRILGKLEKKEIKSLNQMQTLLNTKIIKNTGGGAAGGGASSGGGSSQRKTSGTAGYGVNLPSSAFDENKTVEPDVIDFQDMSSYEWAAESVKYLADKKVINGYSNHEFAPGNNVTRAEFCKMLCGVFGFDTDGEQAADFKDIASGAWYGESVGALHKKGYINGINDTEFMPEANITRQDAFTIIYRILSDMGQIKDADPEEEFNDWNNISDYARPAVSALAGSGLVQGNDGNILPANLMNRAEAAVLLHRLYKEEIVK